MDAFAHLCLPQTKFLPSDDGMLYPAEVFFQIQELLLAGDAIFRSFSLPHCSLWGNFYQYQLFGLV